MCVCVCQAIWLNDPASDEQYMGYSRRVSDVLNTFPNRYV